MARMTGGEAIVAQLRRQGVDTVFGLPGGAALPIYDALTGSRIRHVLMRHEAGAGHAAEGYARATGRPGVAFATSGPSSSPAGRSAVRVPSAVVTVRFSNGAHGMVPSAR